MRGDVDTIKERLDIAEVVSGYVKLEKAGASFKGRCPFHSEKTPSFFVSPARQSFYCFGCGAKGDIFTFVEQLEGLDFRAALKMLAEKAGVELEYKSSESKTEKDKVFNVLEEATSFFENQLLSSEPARAYITSRGISPETTKSWRIGYAPSEWRLLYSHLQSLGYERGIVLKAGLIKDKEEGGEPYDVFRDRIIFPLADPSGRVIAFSGRALAKETEPKYLNSPDTILFTKSEVLYGLDKAKDQIRKKDYAVLVEGQVDLVLSHQAGVVNAVASSGTAFTSLHLERLRRLSPRIILAFDGDAAGQVAAEKAGMLALSMGLEVKVASLPEGEDPAEVAERDPEEWKNIIRNSSPVVEYFFNKVEVLEKDPRKLGKQIVKSILPMIKLLKSSIEQSHFVSLIAKRTGIKEEVLWDDLRKAKVVEKMFTLPGSSASTVEAELPRNVQSQQQQIEERLAEIGLWKKELSESSPELILIETEEIELTDNLASIKLREKLSKLSAELSRGEASKDTKLTEKLTHQIRELHEKIITLETKKKML